VLPFVACRDAGDQAATARIVGDLRRLRSIAGCTGCAHFGLANLVAMLGEPTTSMACDAVPAILPGLCHEGSFGDRLKKNPAAGLLMCGRLTFTPVDKFVPPSSQGLFCPKQSLPTPVLLPRVSPRRRSPSN